MKKIILISMIFIAASYFCFTEEDGSVIEVKQDTVIKKNNMKTVVHFHPCSGIFLNISSLASRQKSEETSLFLYATIEKPFSLESSLIIKPSAWINVPIFQLFGDSHYFSRFGSDVGIRHFSSKKGKGFYTQFQAGIFYVNSRDNYIKYDLAGDVMCYLGYSWKFKKQWNVFIDIGLGVGSHPIVNADFTIITDANLGVGIKF